MAGKASLKTKRATLPVLPDGTHPVFGGNEEDGAVQKVSGWEKEILAKTPIPIAKVDVASSHSMYPAHNLTDGNDRS